MPDHELTGQAPQGSELARPITTTGNTGANHGRTAADFVIVGTSLAGAKATQTLREEGFTGRIVLIGAEAERPYERPPLSKWTRLVNCLIRLSEHQRDRSRDPICWHPH